jgi:hypothetical protein
MTLVRARERLGGHATSHGDAGAIVHVERGGRMHLGVILWSDDTSCDVWLGDDVTKRTRKDAVVPAVAPPGSPFSEIAADARRFVLLEEGQDVHFDEHGRGRLIDKCRWGGLVARADGKIFAIGFRRFSPTP